MNNKEKVFVSVVIYSHNTGADIAITLQQVWDLCQERFENYELVVVDDASTDNSSAAIKEFASQYERKRLTMVSLGTKHGLEVAIQAGIDFTIGDFVFELDSGKLTYPVATLYAMYEKCCEGYDIVSLEPKSGKRLSSRLFYGILNSQAGVKVDVTTQIAHCLTRRALNALSKIKDKTSYRKLLHSLGGYKHSAITVDATAPLPSSYTLREKLQMSSDVLFYFTNFGMNLNVFIALIFAAMAILFGGYAGYMYLFRGNVMEGWTTLMAFLSLGFTGVFIVLAVISKYLSITLRELAALPAYTIKSIEKL